MTPRDAFLIAFVVVLLLLVGGCELSSLEAMEAAR